MRAAALLLGVVALSSLMWGCAGQRVRCDAHLRPINLTLSAAPLRTRHEVPQ